MNDEEIVAQLKNKNQAAFIELVEKYKKKIISLCYSYTDDFQEAEDVSQEVFLSLYNSISNFRGESSLSTYVYRIAISRCLDYKRKKRLKSFLNGLFQVNDLSQGDDLDDRSYIRSIIRELPKDVKTSLVLFYYVGLSQKEIAQILDITPKSVEGRIYRGKQRLKEQLEKEGYKACNKNGII